MKILWCLRKYRWHILESSPQHIYLLHTRRVLCRHGYLPRYLPPANIARYITVCCLHQRPESCQYIYFLVSCVFPWPRKVSSPCYGLQVDLGNARCLLVYWTQGYDVETGKDIQDNLRSPRQLAILHCNSESLSRCAPDFNSRSLRRVSSGCRQLRNMEKGVDRLGIGKKKGKKKRYKNRHRRFSQEFRQPVELKSHHHGRFKVCRPLPWRRYQV